jgi:LEA14-like dessication related protein
MSPKTKIAALAAVAIAAVAVCAAVVAASYGAVSFSLEGAKVDGVQFKDFTFGDVLRLAAALIEYPSDGGASLMSAAAGLIDSVRLNSTLAVCNRGLLPVSIGGFAFDVFADGVHVGNGSYSGSVAVSPGINATIFVIEDLDFAAMSNATVQAFANNGTLEVTVKGEAQAGLFSAPFSMESQIDVKDAVRDFVEDYLARR